MSEKREKAIRERAYALWEKGGSGHGQHGEHWDQATREVDAELSKGKPVAKKAATPMAKRGPKPKLAEPVAKHVPVAKAASPSPAAPKSVTKPASASKAKVAAPTTKVTAPKAKVVAKASSAAEPTPVSTAVGKARQAADKVVATVKRATKPSAKK